MHQAFDQELGKVTFAMVFEYFNYFTLFVLLEFLPYNLMPYIILICLN